MRSSILSLIAAALLVITSVTPSKVESQGLVEYALILVLVPIVAGEEMRMHWRPNPAEHDVYTYRIVVTNQGPSYVNTDGSCTQVVDVTGEAHPGVNTEVIRSVSGNNELLINGDAVLLDDCFLDGDGLILEVGKVIPASLLNAVSGDPYKGNRGIPNILGVSVINADGETADWFVVLTPGVYD